MRPLSVNLPFVLLVVLVLVLDLCSWFRGRGRARERLGSLLRCAMLESWRLRMSLRVVLPPESQRRFCWSSWPCLFLVAGLALGLCGCAGYRLGPANPGLTSGKTVQVNFFGNKTLEPRLVEAINHALRKSLQQDGTYKLNTRGDGDILVNGAILKYERQGVSFQPNDILTVRDYQVMLTVKLTATERVSGRVVLDREVTRRTTLRVGSDLPSAERQAPPSPAGDFARKAAPPPAEGTPGENELHPPPLRGPTVS